MIAGPTVWAFFQPRCRIRSDTRHWRAHIDEFMTYAKGAKTEGADGAKMKKQALANLKAFTNQQGRFFNTITKNKLPAAAVTESFETHIATLTAANDSFAAGKANAYDKLSTAARHMSMTAMDVAGGVDAAMNMPATPTMPPPPPTPD